MNKGELVYACDERSSSLRMKMMAAMNVKGRRRAAAPEVKSAIVPTTKESMVVMM